jgi:Xaa-Pro aminopeptidase
VSAGRADRLVERLVERELDALLITDLVDVRWLTGFTGTNGAALLSTRERLFLTDFRYVEQAEAQVGRNGFEVVLGGRDLLGELAGRLPAGRAGFDDERVTVKAHARLAEKAGGAVELVAAGGVVRELREVKDAGEVERIAAAAELATACFETVVGRGLAGRSERALALDLEHELRLAGAEDPSFPSIVAAGSHGALPHAEPRDAEIPAGVLVTIDWGARLDGYCSDCTRTLASGSVGERERELYELVLRAQEAALAAVEPGAGCAAVDGVAREIIAAAGHGDGFGHGLGHGVGLEVHEGPRLAKGAPGTLVAGNVVTVEPGVYLPGELGVRIEDLAVVGEHGTRVLTSFPKRLTEA